MAKCPLMRGAEVYETLRGCLLLLLLYKMIRIAIRRSHKERQRGATSSKHTFAVLFSLSLS